MNGVSICTEDMHRPQLPESLESIQKAEYFSIQRHRWNTNEEIASILISFDKHEEWLSKEVKIRPKSGSMMLYSRKRVRYRRDGYCWKKRKDGKTTREDHMKLKVQGTECIYGCYVHSAILPTFHRRCYWLLQNPDIVLVHYLNVPYTDDNKIINPTLNYFSDSKKEWTKDELISELKPMFFSENEPDLNNELELSTAETIEAIVQQLMAKQRAKVKAIEDANDIGINARALTVVAAVTTSAKEKQQNQQESQTKINTPIPVAAKQTPTKNPILKRDVTTATCIITTPTAAVNGQRPVANPGSVQLVQIGSTPGASNHGKPSSGQVGQPSGNHAPTSLIFNLSQFQNGSGLLILNSASSSTQTSTATVTSGDSINAPVTLLYSRTNSAASANSSVVVTSNNAKTSPIVSTIPLQIKSAITQKQQQQPIKSTSEIKREVQTTDLSTSNQSSEVVNGALNTTSVDIINGNCAQTKAVEDVEITEHKNECSTVARRLNEEPEMTISSSPIVNDTEQSSMHTSLMNKMGPLHQMGIEGNNNTDHYYQNQSLHNILQSRHYNNINDTDPVDMNPMDFIDNDISTPDEELFNLEAFDMLTEFPNLDDLNNLNSTPFRINSSISAQNSIVSGKSSELYSSFTSGQSDFYYRDGTAHITDYSPEWCYPEGGVKVLVTGPWFSPSHQYSVIFDGVFVQTSLVQSGVLRCYSPSHEPGFVTLQVACDGCIISKSAIFEYRDRVAAPVREPQDYFAVDDNILKFCLLERLEIFESHVSMTSVNDRFKDVRVMKHSLSFEDQVVSMCEEMMCSPWLPFDDSTLTSKSLRSGSSLTDMSLLHLTAALGYTKLTQCLMKWKSENASIVLEMEVDAFSCDKNECTPLMWAFARGHRECALQLYRWNKAAINLCDNQGFSPLHIARQKGFTELVEEIDKLENEGRPMETDLDIDVGVCQPYHNFKRNSTFKSKPRLFKSFSVGCRCAYKDLYDFQNCGLCHSTSYGSDEVSRDDIASAICGSVPGNKKILNSCDISIADGDVDLSIDSSSENNRVLTIAENIIAAMPDRIKAASKASIDEDEFDSLSSDNRDVDNVDIGFKSSFPFEFSDCNYRYRDLGTPTSSPASSCLQSPGSLNDLDSPSPPPTTADFCEFFQASGKIMEKEFSNLTLSDVEQRELYEAARVIQKAYRTYKGRKRQEQEKEKQAAILIQSYYRRYKQYIYYKQMTKAAQVIQTQFRHYCEHKRFKKSSNQDVLMICDEPKSCTNNMLQTTIRNPPYFVSATEIERRHSCSREATPFNCLKRTYSQRRQHQAAKKIQQFLRQSKNKLQKERALAAEEGKRSIEQDSLKPRQPLQEHQKRIDVNHGPHNRQYYTNEAIVKCEKTSK